MLLSMKQSKALKTHRVVQYIPFYHFINMHCNKALKFKLNILDVRFLFFLFFKMSSNQIKLLKIILVLFLYISVAVESQGLTYSLIELKNVRKKSEYSKYINRKQFRDVLP